jgi:hypothetical protein
MSLRWVCHPKLPKAFEIPKPHKKIFNSKPQIPSKTQFLEPDKKLIKKKKTEIKKLYIIYIYIYTQTHITLWSYIYIIMRLKGAFLELKLLKMVEKESAGLLGNQIQRERKTRVRVFTFEL